MGFLPQAIKRIVFLLLVFPILVVFLVTLVNLSGNMEDVIRIHAARLALEECEQTASCSALDSQAKAGQVRSRQTRILSDLNSEPLPERITRQSLRWLTLDWGKALYVRSDIGSDNVIDVILPRLPWTVGLFTTGTLLAAFFGIRLGLRMAARQGTASDKGLTVASLSLVVFPAWVFGMLFLMIFAFQYRVFPLGGYASAPAPTNPLLLFGDFLWHLSLPLLTVTLTSLGAWAYITRAIVLQIVEEDFVKAAHGRGLPKSVVLRKHVLRAAAPPIVTTLALALIASWNGSIIIEGLFNWPGVGQLYWEALGMLDPLPGLPGIGPFDIPLLIALPIVYAFFFIATILVLDFVYRSLDPRVRVFGQSVEAGTRGQ